HELLNRVNHVLGYAELLLDEAEDGPAAGGPPVETLEEIRAAGREVMTAVNALLGPESPADGAQLEAALGPPLRRAAGLAQEIGLDKVAAAARDALELAVGGVAAAAPRVPEPAGPPAAPPAPAADRGVVLVVDDDAANRDVLGRRLVRLGY